MDVANSEAGNVVVMKFWYAPYTNRSSQFPIVLDDADGVDPQEFMLLPEAPVCAYTAISKKKSHQYIIIIYILQEFKNRSYY